MVPSLDGQTFWDLQHHWPSEYKFISRSGAPKANNRVYGEYSSFTATSLYSWSKRAIELGGSRDGPIISIQPVYSHRKTDIEVMIAGRVIPGIWTTAWTFVWKDVPESLAHPTWPSGIIHFSKDERTLKGQFIGLKDVSFHALRSREVGGKSHRLHVFSPQRRRPPVREHVQRTPFPPTNPERYWPAVTLPPDPGPGRKWASWSACLADGVPVLSDSALRRIATFYAQVHRARKACAAAARQLPNGRKSMTMEEVQAVLKITPLPRDLLIENDAVHPTLRNCTLIEQADGSITEILPRTRPLLPGSVNRKASTIRAMFTGDHPRLDLSLPEFLVMGFPHDQHDRSFAILLQASGKEFHRHILHWVAAFLKETDPKKAYLNAFTHRVRTTPPAIGGAVTVKRGMQIKADLVDWRPTVNHTAPHLDEGVLNPKPSRGGPAPVGDHFLRDIPPLATIRNDKGMPRSTNDRIIPTMSQYPPIQYPTPADVGLIACIYLAFGIKLVFSIFDISSCFHCKAVEPCRAAESVFIEDAIGAGMEDGQGTSNIVDYGYSDAADISARCTDNLPKVLDRVMNEMIVKEEARTMTAEERGFRQARGELFGIDSSQAFLSTSFIYVDDMGNFMPEGYAERCADTVNTTVGSQIGYKWVPDKYGKRVYTGFEFKVIHFDQGRIHVKQEKLTAYASSCKAMSGRTATMDKVLESRVGELDHAAQAEPDIKPLLGPFYDCLYVKQTRFKNPSLRPISMKLSHNVDKIVPILEANVGLPLFCDTRRPRHYEVTTLTLRTDASLPSATETCSYNGFGGWFLSRQPDGTLVIHAFYGEWTTEEKMKFAGCIAAAEGATVVFGSILAKARTLMQPHHTDLLELTDSLVAEIKYNKLSYGNPMIERSRLQWEKVSVFDPFFASIDYIPREWSETLRTIHCAFPPPLPSPLYYCF